MNRDDDYEIWFEQRQREHQRQKLRDLMDIAAYLIAFNAVVAGSLMVMNDVNILHGTIIALAGLFTVAIKSDPLK